MYDEKLYNDFTEIDIFNDPSANDLKIKPIIVSNKNPIVIIPFQKDFLKIQQKFPRIIFWKPISQHTVCSWFLTHTKDFFHFITFTLTIKPFMVPILHFTFGHILILCNIECDLKVEYVIINS